MFMGFFKSNWKQPYCGNREYRTCSMLANGSGLSPWLPCLSRATKAGGAR